MNRIAAALALGFAATLGGCATYADVPPVAAAQVEQRAPVTILISIDGFHPDYLDRGFTPTLSGLAENGATASIGRINYFL